ncbi:MAG: ribonuclease Z [Chloroflexi bacterium]|nr:ribonuclease Z [Chloroflexota bacterium]
MLDVCLLGTGGMMPLPGRWLSSVLVRFQGRLLLLDCGEGTQISQKAVGWGFKALGAICLSHYHADHVAGLPGMLLMVGNSGRTEPLTIFGPPGLGRVVAGLRTIAPELPYSVSCVEPAPGQVVECQGLQLSALPLDHALPCLAYALEAPRARPFLPERAQALSVPVQLWSRLQRGEAVEWAGRRVAPDEVLGPPRPGLRLVYATDTRPTPELPAFVGGADLFVCEATYGDPADMPKAVERKHMTFAEAAHLARAGQARQVWLTHFSPALEEPQRYLDQAQAIFPNTVLGYDHLQTSLRFAQT